MTQKSFEHEIFIRSDVRTVLQAVTDMKQSLSIHPLIIKVDEVPPSDGALKRYIITDSLKWGPFKFKLKYRVDVIEVAENHARLIAIPSSWMKIESLMQVSPREDGVTLKESYVMHAPALVFDYSFKQAQESHRISFQNLKAFLENKKS